MNSARREAAGVATARRCGHSLSVTAASSPRQAQGEAQPFAPEEHQRPDTKPSSGDRRRPSVFDDYGSMLDTFRSDYKSYESKLSSAINIDCSKQPVAFYDAVSLARENRNRVHMDVVRLNQYIDQYQSAVAQFKEDYLTAAEGIKK